MSDPDFLNQLVGSPCCLPRLPEAELFPIYAELGLRKFEGFSEWAACRHEWTSDPQAARARAEASGLRFTSYHLPPIGDDTEVGLAAALKAARFAAGIGAGIVLFKARRLELFEAVGLRFLDALEEQKIPVVPVLQNHAGSAISTLDDYRKALAAFAGDRRIRAILEVGHFRRVGVDWRPGWDLLGERIALIHVNEIREGKSVHYGTGEVDFAGLVRQIKTAGYGGDVVVELELENSGTDTQETVTGLGNAIRMLCQLYREA